MAGAVTAGAYTAGVVDFLMQALWEWQQHRDTSPVTDGEREVIATIPQVEIPVLSGTSAGGMTAGMLAAALVRRDPAQPFAAGEFQRLFGRAPSEADQKIKCFLPALYRAWVERPSIAETDSGGFDLCAEADLQDGYLDREGIRSILDATKLTAIVAELLDQTHNTFENHGLPQLPKVADQPVKVPFISGEFHLYLTTTNLVGLPFDVDFGTNVHGMRLHGDRVHVVLEGVGSGPFKSPFARNDPYYTLSATIPLAPHAPQHVPYDAPLIAAGSARPIAAIGAIDTADYSLSWDEFAFGAALATGAFPIGLAARYVPTRLHGGYILKHGPKEPGRLLPQQWLFKGYDEQGNVTARVLKPREDLFAPLPASVPGRFESAPLTYAAVDGGAIDNEPYEWARFSLMARPGKSLTTSVTEGSVPAAVLMIDPFPEPPTWPAFRIDGPKPLRLAAAAGALQDTLVQQARFKFADVLKAQDDDVRSRYLIQPSRSGGRPASTTDRGDMKAEVTGSAAIGCGVAAGFGGFFDRSLRDHDFQLGRRNCQWFLLDIFTFPTKDPPQTPAPEVGYLYSRTTQGAASKQREVCYVPLVKTAAAQVPLPTWPRVPTVRVQRIADAVAGRLRALARALVRPATGSKWIVRQGLEAVLVASRISWFGPTWETKINRAITTQLVGHGLLAEVVDPLHQLPGPYSLEDKLHAAKALLVAVGEAGRSPISLATATKHMGTKPIAADTMFLAAIASTLVSAGVLKQEIADGGGPRYTWAS